MKELNLAASGTLRPGLRVFLNGMLRQPSWVVVIALVALIPFGVGLSKIEKDPSVDAFVPQDHPAAAARDQAREWFGLEDPIVIALIGEGERPVFTARGLSALRELHEKVEAIPGVRSADVISLHNKNLISGKDGDLQVDPIIEPGPVTEESARVALERVRAMPMLMGLLATHKGNVATIIAPVKHVARRRDTPQTQGDKGE